MSAWRETADGRVEILPHRLRTVLLTAGSVLFTLIGVLIVLAEPTAWFGWLAILLFGVAGAFAIRRWWRAGLFRGKPALVLGPDGLDDRQGGLRVPWEEVEAVELRELSTRGGTHRFLGVRVRDPNRVFGGLGRMRRLLAHVNLPGWPPVNVPLSMLATTPDELGGLVRRFYGGPIEGFESELDPTPERPSRARRFGRWLRSAAVNVAIAAAVVALLVWLRG